MRNPVRCDGDLRLMTNRSFVSIELRASGIARGDLIAEWQLVFADRSERIYQGRTDRLDSSIRYGEGARDGKPVDRLPVQRSAR